MHTFLIVLAILAAFIVVAVVAGLLFAIGFGYAMKAFVEAFLDGWNRR